MSLSRPELAEVVSLLDSDLRGARVRAARASDRESESVVLELRAPGRSHHLLISATSGSTRLHRIEDVPKQPREPGAFVMLLRKRAVGGVLQRVELTPADRIVRLALHVLWAADSDEDAELVELALVAELTGRHGNLFLVDAGDRILGAHLKNKSTTRRLVPGATWTPPASHAAAGAVRPDWPADGIEAFLEHAYGTRVVAVDAAQLRTQLAARLRSEAKRTRRTIAAVENDIAAIEGAAALQREAELLRGAYGAVARGASEVEVPDWYADGQLTKIELDPRLDLEGNIASRFRQAKRLKRGAAVADQRWESLNERLTSIESLRERVAAGSDDQLDALQREAVALVPRKKQRRVPGQAAPRKPYHAFVSSDGVPILVGRGSRDNDELTFHVARGNDIWMHAADFPGSHVIVRAPRNGEVPVRTLEDAALLAAHYSKGRGDTVVGITWTQRKHVRKPRGGAPGRVTLAGGKTIEVREDAERLAHLFASRDQGSPGG